MKIAKIENSNRRVVLKDNGLWDYYETIDDVLNYSFDDLIKKEVDKMTKIEKRSFIEGINISNYSDDSRLSFYGFSEKNADYMYLGIHAYGAGDCIEEGSEIIFLFKDEQIIKLQNTNEYNCDNLATLYMTIEKFEYTINYLRTVELDAVRVHTEDGYVQVEFDEIHSLKIKKSIQFLLE